MAKAIGQYPWVAEYTDRSITELEIRHFGLRNKQGLFFFRSDNAPSSEPPSHAKRLLDLKREIVDSGQHCESYSSAEELASRVESLLQSKIEAEFGAVANASDPLQRERQSHREYAAARCVLNVGRHSNFNWLDEQVASADRSASVVIGESGSGKTSFICNWVRSLRDSHPRLYVLEHYVGCTLESTMLENMLRRICNEIKQRFSIQQNVASDLATLVLEFPRWLSEPVLRGFELVLVIDALNQLQEKNEARELGWLPLRVPRGCHLVVSTLRGACLDCLSARSWPMRSIMPLSHSEKLIFAQHYYRLFGKTLSESQLKIVAAKPQACNPLFVMLVLDYLRKNAVFENMDELARELMSCDDVPALLACLFRKIAHELHEKTSVTLESVLVLVYASLRGLSEGDAQRILRVPAAKWASALSLVSQFLVPNSAKLTFFHDHVRKAAKRLIKGSLPDARRRIVGHFNSEPITLENALESAYQMSKLARFDVQSSLPLCRYVLQPAVFTLLFSDQHKYTLYAYWKMFPAREAKSLIESRIRYVSGDPVRHYLLIRDYGIFLEEVAEYEAAERVLLQGVAFGKLQNIDDGTMGGRLGYVYRMMGRYASSVEWLQQSLTLARASKGERDREVLWMMNNLAIAYRHQGEYKQAEPLYMRTLQARKMLFGEHPDTAESLNSLGCLLQDQGRINEALEMFREGKRIRVNWFGEKHVDVALSYGNIGGALGELNNFQEARQCYETSLNIYREIVGEQHPFALGARNSVAGLLQECGQFEEAEAMARSLVRDAVITLGGNHPDVALYLHDLGVLLQRKRLFDEAESLYHRALDIRRVKLGEKHPDIAQSLNAIGSVCQELGKLDEALSLFEQALLIVQNCFGAEHPDAALVLLSIAGTLIMKREYAKCESLYAQVMSIYTKAYGRLHQEVARTLNDNAVLQTLLGNTSEALRCSSEAVTIYENVFGPAHVSAAEAHYNYASLLREAGLVGEAREHFNRAIGVFDTLFVDHPSSLEAKKILATLR
jgi:nephrocystin-3